MAGRGPAPKPPEERRRRNKVVRGEWQHAPEGGWQHGEIPKPPPKLLKASKDAWESWFGAWYAAFWEPQDVPVLRQAIRLYDACERGELQRHGELRLVLDTMGITPKGRQDRRWRPPVDDSSAAPERPERESRYGHLRAVGDG